MRNHRFNRQALWASALCFIALVAGCRNFSGSTPEETPPKRSSIVINANTGQEQAAQPAPTPAPSPTPAPTPEPTTAPVSSEVTALRTQNEQLQRRLAALEARQQQAAPPAPQPAAPASQPTVQAGAPNPAPQPAANAANLQRLLALMGDRFNFEVGCAGNSLAMPVLQLALGRVAVDVVGESGTTPLMRDGRLVANQWVIVQVTRASSQLISTLEYNTRWSARNRSGGAQLATDAGGYISKTIVRPLDLSVGGARSNFLTVSVDGKDWHVRFFPLPANYREVCVAGTQQISFWGRLPGLNQDTSFTNDMAHPGKVELRSAPDTALWGNGPIQLLRQDRPADDVHAFTTYQVMLTPSS